METDVPATASKTILAHVSLSPRARGHFERLKKAVGVFHTDLAVMQVTQVANHEEVMAHLTHIQQILE